MSKMLLLKKLDLYDHFNSMNKVYLSLISAVDKANVKDLPIDAPAITYYIKNASHDTFQYGQFGVDCYANTSIKSLIGSMLIRMYDSVPKLNPDSYNEDPLQALDDDLTYDEIAEKFITILYRSVGNDTND